MQSYYSASRNKSLAFPALEGEESADICVIGAGYTGLSSALHLAEMGYKVVVLEAETVGFGASGRNGGHVGTGQRKDQFISRNTLAMKLPLACGIWVWRRWTPLRV